MHTRALLTSLLCLAASTAAADYQFMPVSDPVAYETQSRLAASPDGRMLIVWASDGEVRSRCWANGDLSPIADHGAGAEPTASWLQGQFWLAWVDAEGLRVCSGDGTAWTTDTLLVAQSAPPLARPVLCGGTAPYWSDGMLDLYFADDGGHLLNNWYGEWPPESGNWSWYAGGPWTVVTGYDWYPPIGCRIYGEISSYLFYSTGVGTYRYNWSPPLVGEEGAGPADQFAAAVDRDESMRTHVLGTGIQPICYCNKVYYCYGPTLEPPYYIDWSPVEDLTQYAEIYTWPRDPSLVNDPTNTLHAFWYQRHADGGMNVLYNRLIYMRRESGVWVDHSDLFAGQDVAFNASTHMVLDAANKPAFAFVKEEGATRRLWLALDLDATAVPETPATSVALRAYPNPFNPKTEIHFDAPAGPLVVTVHDVAGRNLRTLYDGTVAGSGDVEWDGLDRDGRGLPSGIYLLRAQSGSSSSSLKLVMLR